MLIGIDASRANRDRKSGTEYYSYYLIRNLAKIDRKNNYILYTDKPLAKGLSDLTTSDDNIKTSNHTIEFDKDGYQVIRSPYNNFKAKILKWPFRYFWTIGRLSLEMIISKPDLLFVPAHSLPIFLPKKSVNTIHDIAFERERNIYHDDHIGYKHSIGKRMVNFFSKLYTFGKFGSSAIDYLRWSTIYALKRATKIIAISNFTKNELIEVYKANQEKIDVVHNGFNNLIYKKLNDLDKLKNILQKYEIETPYILFIGRLEKKKNTPALIEAFAIAKEKNKDIKEKLVLIGFGSYGYDEVKYMINEFNLYDEVIMPGWVEEEDIPYLYNGAKAFIFPSRHEGFGIPIIQSMNSETPVACSNIPVLKEVAGEAALFFDPKNVQSIASAIEKITTDKSLREDLIYKGKERAKKYSWNKCAKDTLESLNGA